ncbi:phosphoglycerate mutase-like protein 1 isoform X3 [Mangifera indica]|uniref:phosphoglycerate mutase-like protein 1 isoform X3 n=1 Tax=Mangifera indica TaxID=29780 RepID=UPI001CFB6017|nr:phosphoglycerate mutase-like protein 1 isoform X3 [Mangifera indica]
MTTLTICPTGYYSPNYNKYNKLIPRAFPSSSSTYLIFNRSFESTALTSTSPLSLRCFSSPYPVEDMDGGVGPTLYPLHRCKTLHLVRHAQGIHNVDGDKNFKAYMTPEYFDAHLTQLGWKQVENLRKHVHETGLVKRIDLVIASPLLRTLQTAVGVFGGEGYEDRMDVVPLMVANAGNSGRAAISSLNCPPVIAVELCREHLGVHPCDKRRNISDYQFLFPAVDFSLVESDEDVWWKANVRETREEVAARGLKFMNWLWTRKEKEIAIVTHSGFLFHTLTTFGNDCHPSVKTEICKHFANCELRSMVIVDRSMTGSDTSTTNYPGNIPSRLDLPSGVAHKKLEKEETSSND